MGLGSRVCQGSRLVSGLGFRVWGFAFEVEGCGEGFL